MAFIPNIDLISRHKGRIIMYALVFWLIIGFLVFATQVAAHFFLHTPLIDSFDQKQYLLRWLLWLLLTPAIILSGLKVNIRDYNIVPFILLHILLATVVLAVDFNIEVVVLRSAADHFYGRHIHVREFLEPFMFKYFAYIIIYFLIVGAVNIYVYMAEMQQIQKTLHDAEMQNNALQYQLTVSKLRALRMQVHPHFLFNTHNSVIGLIVKKENEKASEMLAKLSDMMRLTLDEQTEEFVTLNEELKIADIYLDIQRVRFPDRFTYTRNVSPEAGSFLLPYLLLQPLVENAVMHGVESADEDAFINITAAVSGGMLDISISNNNSEYAARPGRGIGIANVTGRLQHYYGERASFTFMPSQGGTTVARLKIPAYEP